MKNKRDHSYVDPALIREMLYENEEYIREFAAATEKSFTEFCEHYEQYLLEGNEDKFRKAGHKIKPVAQMLGIDELVEEYENGKRLLQTKGDIEELKKSINNIHAICEQVVNELKALT